MRVDANLDPKRILKSYAEARREDRFELFREHEALQEAFLGIEAKGIARAMREARARRDTR